MDILSLLIGLAAGIIIAYLLFRVLTERNRGASKEEAGQMRGEISSLQLEKGRSEERASMLEGQVTRMQEELAAERSALMEARTALAAAEAEIGNAQEKLSEQKGQIGELQEQFTAAFKNLANEILEEKSQKFTDLNRENLGALLTPLHEKIRDFEKTISSTYANEVRERATLAEQIRHLTELNQQITREASNLTTALKGQSKTQGDWGELILEQILERSGLTKGTHYLVQESLQGQDGKTQRPDVIILLPDNKRLIVDSKVSLTAYTEYTRADDVLTQKDFLLQHIDSVRRHIKTLSEKRYQDIDGLQSVDFVLMFIPLEPAFALAVKNDLSLYMEAFDRNIVIVTTSTLLATLRTIGGMWRQENQNRNALEIARKSGELHDKFAAFVNDLEGIGNRLDAARDAHAAALNKLTSGKGNLIRRAAELKDMGARASKTLPPHLLERATDDGDDPGGTAGEP
jgi:DNA recombination protein RmuC